MKVILCGYNWSGCKALEILLRGKHEVFVFTHESPYYVNNLEGFCKKKQIPYSLEKVRLSTLPFFPDLIVSIYYRFIIPAEVIASCNGKIFNLHPSLLPAYRGCSSLTWALINGEAQTGFTYHYIDQGIDTGNIILQQPLPIEDFDTQQSLYFRVMFNALEHLQEVIDKVVSGFSGTPQPKSDASSYYKRGCPHDGILQQSWDDDKKERFIRAMIYPPLPPAKYGDQEIYSFQQFEQIVTP